MICQECHREFPEHLVNDLETGRIGGRREFKKMCPLCAYSKYMNPALELPPATPPSKRMAPRAYKLWTEAVEHVRKTGQE
jgi:hypothetical protein